jgi:class 3 adenylate cyclase/tetratricopeptide (TPR) repeat protein
MKCRSCNAENAENARFCSQCGVSFACPNCGALNELGANVCARCGAVLLFEKGERISIHDGERRQLSLIFSDLVGSTALSERLDPEDLRTILHDYGAACSKVIALYEGCVVQYLGDGILACFGYPAAHEDDARRAVQAGLGIIEAMRAIRERFLRETGAEIGVRVGIHTGLVVVGATGTKDVLESPFVGNAPNLAARIQSAAEANTVVVSSETYRLTRGFFEAVDYGIHQLKGVSQAVQLYRIIHESTARSRLDAASGKLTPLAGRDKELQLIFSRWHRAEEGAGQVILLSGEPGVGKSRLVLALKERAGNDPESWLTELRCSPDHQNSSFYPVIDFLERVSLKFERDDSPSDKLLKIEGFVLQYGLDSAEAAPLIASLLSVPLSDQYEPLGLTPQRQKQKTIETLSAVLLARAYRQPVLFIVEDLHWVDPSLLEMLDELVGRAVNQKILIFLTYRPQFVPHWPQQDHFTRVELAGLAKKHAEEVIRRVAGNKDLPREAVDHILSKTDCVPLFLEELTKAILDSDMILEKEGRYELAAPLERLGIPSTLQDSLTSRLDRMQGAKAVAQLAATIGREFTYEMLAAIPGDHRQNLRAQLDRLVEARILYQKGYPPNESYIFKHALIQDSSYSSLLKSRRRAYHSQIAETIEEKFPEIIETRPELLAQHYTEATLFQKAIEYWLLAGIRALRQSANREAISHLRRGLALVNQLPEPALRAPLELQLQATIGPALIAMKGFGDSEVGEAYARAGELGAKLGQGPHLFAVTWGQWVYHLVKDNLNKARSLALEMKHLGEMSHDSAMLIEAHWTLGNTLFWLCRLEESRANLEKAIEIYDQAKHHPNAYSYGQDPGVAAYCYAGLTYSVLGFPEKAAGAQRSAIDLARSLKHPFSIGWALAFRFMINMLNRDYAGALEAADETTAYCTEQAYLFWLYAGMIVRGWAIAHLEHPKTGIVILEQGLSGWEMIGSIIVKPMFLGLLGEALALSGDIEKALVPVNEGIEIARTHGELISELFLQRINGALLHKDGNVNEAEAVLRDTVERSMKLGARSHALSAAIELADARRRAPSASDGKETVKRILSTYVEGFGTPLLKRAQQIANT